MTILTDAFMWVCVILLDKQSKCTLCKKSLIYWQGTGHDDEYLLAIKLLTSFHFNVASNMNVEIPCSNVCKYVHSSTSFSCLLVCCMWFRLLKRISDDATWISELEMFYFMLSMYLSSWWWVRGCMDELQTTGAMWLVVSDIFIPHLSFQG